MEKYNQKVLDLIYTYVEGNYKAMNDIVKAIENGSKDDTRKLLYSLRAKLKMGIALNSLLSDVCMDLDYNDKRIVDTAIFEALDKQLISPKSKAITQKLIELRNQFIDLHLWQ